MRAVLRLLSALRVQSWPLLRVVAVNEPLLPLAAIKSNMGEKTLKDALAECTSKGSQPATSTSGAAAAGTAASVATAALLLSMIA